MRRLLATLTVLVAFLLGLPATAGAAPAPIGGGSALFTLAGGHCTAAFAATGSGYGHLLAGPGCGTTPASVYSGATVLVGPMLAGTAAYSAVRVTNTAAWTLVGWIDGGSGKIAVTGSQQTPIGGQVCLVDRRFGTRCGTVTAVNQTVSYPGGVVTGLTRTNICVEPGGTPVAYLSGSQAQGVPFIGSGSCASGGSSFFTPVNRILAAYGLTLLTG
ncbi:MAG TPA: S1 family peptidase [Actinophytocola sp.]|jgi:streptogrisin C|nr:S1 family peptidase [Actinophytocola sp.]